MRVVTLLRLAPTIHCILTSIIVFLYSSVFRDPSLVFNPTETTAHEYVLIEFHCLLSAVQWGFNNSSKVYIRFDAPQLGRFKHCYGPMKRINRFADYVLYIV